jgi:hypothetical protein
MLGKFVSFFISFVFILIVCWFIGLGLIAYKAAGIAGEQDWSGGIKPMLEKIWCGEKDCLNK